MPQADLDCPECGVKMELAPSQFGKPGRMYYRCSNYPQCRGAHGAHPDGTPLGVPANAQTKQARIQAHNSFDKLWKGDPPLMSRTSAYMEMQDLMGMSSQQAHIGRFSFEECWKLMDLLKEKHGLYPFEILDMEPLGDLFDD